MKYIEELLQEELLSTAKKIGYKEANFVVIPCSLPIADYQTSSCMGLAKTYHKSPFDIATDIVCNIKSIIASKIEVCKPGYINITISQEFLSQYLIEYMNNYEDDIKTRATCYKTIIDYGGANVAKPLHVGHLRTANIGESLKRICRFVGCETIGDVHLGDWGLQMGLVITEIKHLHPNLVYFDDNFLGEYPKEPPITIDDLNTLYPTAREKSKEDENYLNEAKQATFFLQQGKRGYKALWQHIVNVSKQDLKKNYDMLNVSFDLWLGESDAQSDSEKMVKFFVDKGFAKKSDGALIVDIAHNDDKKELPPFMLVKSDGAILYSTTDLATLYDRVTRQKAERVIYVVDNRQELHFTQLFRVCQDYPVFDKIPKLDFAGFGTINGKDGKPYKTRDGKAMGLEILINEVKQSARKHTDDLTIADSVAISALKFADLSILRTKDYICDPDKICSFDGKTGPYLLYSLTRAKSILRKIFGDKKPNITSFDSSYCNKDLLLYFTQFEKAILEAYDTLSPNILCDYAYKIANMFNSNYSKTNISKEENKDKQLALVYETMGFVSLLEKTLNLLAIKTLEKM